jgi:hypothetical protein
MFVELLFVQLCVLQLSPGKAKTLAANSVFAHCNLQQGIGPSAAVQIAFETAWAFATTALAHSDKESCISYFFNVSQTEALNTFEEASCARR